MDNPRFHENYILYSLLDGKMIFLEWNMKMHQDNLTGKHLGPDGTIVYYLNGMIHRVDGPAIIMSDNSKIWWYLNDVGYRFNEWLRLTPIDEEEKAMLKLIYG